MNKKLLWQIAYDCLYNNSTQEGFCASGRQEVYGCFFGRDSALTILKILKAHEKNPTLPLLEISKRSLQTFISLQGKQFNIESGEQPGKFIHEFRKDNYERLLSLEKPWYVYPDGVLRNYDSIDSTPLGLIAIYKYYQITNDSEFLMESLNAVEAGLNWIITYGDIDKDGLIEYELPLIRRFGGLVVQSWTDSHESLLQSDGKMPSYPIAPVEAQGYAWLALKLWAKFYKETSSQFAQKLENQAALMKKSFNEKFIILDNDKYYFAQALDGGKNQIKTVTANPLICLWASFPGEGTSESIIEDKYLEQLVSRAFEEDLFDPYGGLRTMSKKSPTYNPNQNSYHNGSFWPILNGLCLEGLEFLGFKKEARKLKRSSLMAIKHFKTPIELYMVNENGEFLEYQNEFGQVGCREQAWSAAVMLDLLSTS